MIEFLPPLRLMEFLMMKAFLIGFFYPSSSPLWKISSCSLILLSPSRLLVSLRFIFSMEAMAFANSLLKKGKVPEALVFLCVMTWVRELAL